MDYYDSARFAPRRDSALVAIAADICHMAADFVSAILRCADHIAPVADGSGANP